MCEHTVTGKGMFGQKRETSKNSQGH